MSFGNGARRNFLYVWYWRKSRSRHCFLCRLSPSMSGRCARWGAEYRHYETDEKGERFCIDGRFLSEALEEDDGYGIPVLTRPTRPGAVTVQPGFFSREIAARSAAKFRDPPCTGRMFCRSFWTNPAAYSMADETARMSYQLTRGTGLYEDCTPFPDSGLGYGITSDEALLTETDLCRSASRGACPCPAQEAGIAALDEEERAGKRRENYIRMRSAARMEEAFAPCWEWKYVPSEANLHPCLHCEKDLLRRVKEAEVS